MNSGIRRNHLRKDIEDWLRYRLVVDIYQITRLGINLQSFVEAQRRLYLIRLYNISRQYS